MRARLALMAAVAVLGSAAPVAAPGSSSAGAGGDGAVRAQLVAVYRAVDDVVAAGRAAGAPAAVATLPLTTARYEATVAELTAADVTALGAQLAAVPEWGGVAGGYAGVARGLAASSFEPSRPVAPTETNACPDPPPGPDVGNYSILTGEYAATLFEAVAEPTPNSQVVFQLSLPNPLKIVAVALRVAAQIASRTLTYLRDIYWDCGSLDLFAAAENTENTALQLYGLTSDANDAVNRINEGLRAMSERVEQLQGSQDELQRLRIQQALAAPVGTIVNVAYVLPASEGGYLDATPVGVRAVVADTLLAARQAPVAVNAAAIVYEAQAGAALAAGDYATAYRLYQRSYQTIGR